MNDEVAKYALLTGLVACSLIFLACAALTLFLIPMAFGSGFKAFSQTKDPRDILTARTESRWILPVYLLLRKLQRLAGTSALALGIGMMVWTLLVTIAR